MEEGILAYLNEVWQTGRVQQKSVGWSPSGLPSENLLTVCLLFLIYLCFPEPPALRPELRVSLRRPVRLRASHLVAALPVCP